MEQLTPKFRTIKGNLTPYAFACGYIQWASIDGKEISKWENGKELFLDGNYQVKKYKDGDRVLWESFETLTEARQVYNRLRID